MNARRVRTALRRSLVSLLLALVPGALIAGLYLFERSLGLDVLESIECKLLDLRFRLRGPRVPEEGVAIVAIDSRSVERLGRWPWSRRLQAQLLDRLREWGASAVAFDVLFTEPEGVAESARLQRIAAALPPESPGALREALDAAVAEVAADRALAQAFERAAAADAALPVLAFDFVFERDLVHTGQAGSALTREDEQLVLDLASYPSRDENVAALRLAPPRLALGLRPVIADLAGYAAGIGFVNPVYDVDGFVRRESMVVAYSPAAKSAFEAGRDPREAIRDPRSPVQAFMPLAMAGVLAHKRVALQDVVLDLPRGEVRVAIATPEGRRERRVRFDPADATMRIDFYGPSRTFPTWSFVDVLEGGLRDARGRPVAGREALAGKLVFVGATDPGIADDFPTPFTARLPGVEKHANVAAGFLEQLQLRGPPMEDGIALASVALGVLLVGAVAGNLGAARAALFLVALLGAWLGLTYRDFVGREVVWNWTLPALTIVFGFGAVVAYRQVTEERAKREIRSAFSTYMSPAAVEEVLSDPDKLKLGGERRTCTIFFSDLVGFTSLSEALADPQALVKLMNRYLGRMTALILEEDGILDKYIGDAIMAIFGAPLVRPDHAARGCHAALRNLAALEKLREEFRAEGLPEIDCRIGLNTGEVVIGNMGSEVRMDYTVLGDPVNLASRLEGANKPYGTRIMVGPQTRAEAAAHDPALVFRPLDLLAVKGKSEPVQVFELVGTDATVPGAKRELLAAYGRALDLYRAARFAEALPAFEAALRLDPGDGPSKTYLERCREFIAEPPPPDWDGVYHMKTK